MKFTWLARLSACALMAWPSNVWATFGIGLTDNADTYYLGCVTRANKTARIWGCDKATGAWTEVNADCVMDEDINIVGEGGGDVILVGHSSTDLYWCGGEWRAYGQITHSWGGNIWDIGVFGETGPDYLAGDASRYTNLLGYTGLDELRLWGPGYADGNVNADRLFSHSSSGSTDQLYGAGSGDCIQDDNDFVTVFSCGGDWDTYRCGSDANWAECSATSPGQPDSYCNETVESCEVGPG